MDSKTYNKELRKACVEAVFDEFETHGEIVHPFKDGDAEAMRSLDRIVGYVDLDVSGLVDLILDTIGREPSDRSPVGADSHVSEPLELLTDETGIIAANQR